MRAVPRCLVCTYMWHIWHDDAFTTPASAAVTVQGYLLVGGACSLIASACFWVPACSPGVPGTALWHGHDIELRFVAFLILATKLFWPWKKSEAMP